MFSETTDMKSWMVPDFQIIPHNFPYQDLTIDPATPLFEILDLETKEMVAVGEFELGPTEELGEDAEDLLDAMATERKYYFKGKKGFRPYRGYRGQKFQQNG